MARVHARIKDRERIVPPCAIHKLPADTNIPGIVFQVQRDKKTGRQVREGE